MATLMLLGNTAVVEKFRDRGDNSVKKRKRQDLRNQVTQVHFPEGTTLVEVVKNVADLWPWHSDADGPEWVESEDPLFAVAVAQHFTWGETPATKGQPGRDAHVCVVGRPLNWNEG